MIKVGDIVIDGYGNRAAVVSVQDTYTSKMVILDNGKFFYTKDIACLKINDSTWEMVD